MEPFVATLPSPDATRALGRALAACALRPGLVIALDGPLGAGKTSLAKALVSAACGVSEDDVPSPTFAIACEYRGNPGVLHLDAYRLASPRDLDDLGFGALDREARAVLVEWASRVEAALPPDRLHVEIEHAEPGRRARVRALGPRAEEALGRLAGSFRAGLEPGRYDAEGRRAGQC